MSERVLCMFSQTFPPPLLAIVLKRWMHVFVVAAFLFFIVCVCVYVFNNNNFVSVYNTEKKKKKEIRQFCVLSKVLGYVENN